MRNEDKISIVYSTCNEYSFLWKDFLKLFKLFFAEKSTIYSTASIYCEYDGIKLIPTTKSKDQSFSSRLISCLLDNVTNDFVLFILDDFFFFDKVDVNVVDLAYDLLTKDNRIGMVCLHDMIPYSGRCNDIYNDDFGVIDKTLPFSINTQVSLWRKSFFLKVLRYGESAWEFENYASYRNKFYKEKSLYIKDKYCHAFFYVDGGVLNRGVIRKEAIPFFLMFNIDFSRYPKTLVDNNLRKNKMFTRIINAFKKRLYMFMSVFIGKNK